MKADKFLEEWVRIFSIESDEIDSCRFTGYQMCQFAEAYLESLLKKHWISVEEILPSQRSKVTARYVDEGTTFYDGTLSEPVLVYDPNHPDKIMIATIDERGNWEDGNDITLNPTHWMNLPTKPEAK